MNDNILIMFFFIFLLAIAIFIKKLSRSFSVRVSGSIGEYHVRQSLLPLEGYKKFLSNCYLPKEDGTFTEVDLILLHESGIYVIESKNYSGWIFGKDYEQYWTQSFGRRKSQRSRFFNPIIQNAVHVKWLREYIGKDFPIYSYIVFGDHCELKNITVTKPGYFVTNCRFLLAAIRQNASETACKIPNPVLDSLYQKLYPLTQVTKEQKIQHIQTVQAKKERPPVRVVAAERVPTPVQVEPMPTPQKIETPSTPSPTDSDSQRKCPRCGGTLVLRTVKSGERAGKKLWGCSNYPQCRFIENVEEEDLKPSPAVATEERKCPQCGGTLVLRIAKSGERAGKKLWGCSNYPNCRFIENIEES